MRAKDAMVSYYLLRFKVNERKAFEIFDIIVGDLSWHLTGLANEMQNSGVFSIGEREGGNRISLEKFM